MASLVLDKHELVVWFLDHGANPNAECKRSVSPFKEVAPKASLEIVQPLHRCGPRLGITATCAAQSSVPDRFEVLRILLGIGTPIDAIEFEHTKIGQASIIQLCPATNHAVCNKETNTEEKGKMVELLLARGARIDIPLFLQADGGGLDKRVWSSENDRNDARVYSTEVQDIMPRRKRWIDLCL
jgi:hypothetical protein